MSEDYNPNSIDATLSRIETKLNNALEQQEKQESSIRKLWAALNQLHVKVAGVAAVVSIGMLVAKHYLFNH